MNPPELTHPSIADIPEDELVQVLLADPYWRSRLIELYGVPRGALDKQRVLLNTAPGHFLGDIDILLCAPDRPDQAVAFQVKRIKFGMSQLCNGTPSKLGEFKKAVQQANLLVEVGFWKVYLYVITVVDSRQQNRGQTSYAGLSNELKQKVASAVSVQYLNERVGLFAVDLTQAMDHPPLTVDAFGGHLRRRAAEAPQSEELTNWVARLFSETGAEVAS